MATLNIEERSGVRELLARIFLFKEKHSLQKPSRKHGHVALNIKWTAERGSISANRSLSDKQLAFGNIFILF